MDKYGQIVGTDFISKVRVNFDTTSLSERQNLYPPIIEGSNIFDVIGGVAVISDIIVVGTPGTSYQLTFSTDGIDLSKTSNKDVMNKEGLSNLNFNLDFNLRECEVGEQFTVAGKCQLCQGSYSLIKMSEPGSCDVCPKEKAKCLGGAQIGPLPGYWRRNNESKIFSQCLYELACLGMIPPNNNILGECSKGYRGVLCADCEIGFSRDNDFQCSFCPIPFLNSLRLLAILTAVVILVVFMIRSSLNGAMDANNVTSIYLKILLNHFQLILVTASFDFRWSQQIVEFFSSTKQVATASTQIFSFDCFLDKRSSNDQSSQGLNRIFFQKLIMIALLPFLLTILCFIVWNTYMKIQKNQVEMRGKILSSLVILLFLVHPSLVTYSFQNFKCKEVEGEQRVQDDLEIQCWSTVHNVYSYFVALPSIIVWGLGIPFFALIILIKRRKQLNSFDIRQSYGFLYRGYRKDYYYWEIVIMYRKICIIFTAVFISNFGVVAQALIVFFILIIFLLINFKKQPFNTLVLNDLETLSLITSMVTIYCGLFFILNKPQEWIEENPDYARGSVSLSIGFQRLFFALILISNLLFFTYWSLKMYEEAKAKFREKFTKIYLALCLCFNKNKLEAEIIAQDIEQQNINYYQQLSSQLKLIKKQFRNGELKLNKNNIERLLISLSLEQIKKQVRPREYESFDANHFEREQKRLLRRKYSISKIEQAKHSLHRQNNNQNLKKQSALEQKFEQNEADYYEEITQYYRDEESRFQTIQTDDSQLDINFEINSQKARRKTLSQSQRGLSFNFKQNRDNQIEKGFRYNRFKKDKIDTILMSQQNVRLPQSNLSNQVDTSSSNKQSQYNKSLTKVENKVQNNNFLRIRRELPEMLLKATTQNQNQSKNLQYSPANMINQLPYQFQSSNQSQLESLQESVSQIDQNSSIYEEILEEDQSQQTEEFIKIANEYNSKKKSNFIQVSKRQTQKGKFGVKRNKHQMMLDSKVNRDSQGFPENLRTSRQMQNKAQSEYQEQQLSIEFIKDEDELSENPYSNNQNIIQEKIQTEQQEQEIAEISNSVVDKIDYEQEEIKYDDNNIIIFSNREEQIQLHKTKAFQPTKSFIIKQNKLQTQNKLTELTKSNKESNTKQELNIIQDENDCQEDLNEMVLELLDYTYNSEKTFENNKNFEQSQNFSSFGCNDIDDSQKLLSTQKMETKN
ncbi:UNKNOWN [Stylonychia lemnae]|uniref:Transmembrane protein n=1 Tax=Stylonychia lemnae TaxID=5949 RepID=A0A078AI88_STYLE|nr:UNKNOWN [Stylonychia lemnae]|eukprot:CDW81646.1 UNKNOWN [Stylonychia lemnae]